MTLPLRSSLGWTYGTGAISLLLQIAFVAAIGRLVSPQDYGTVAVAAAAVGYLAYFCDFGVAQTTMRDRSLTIGDLWGVALIACTGNLLVMAGLWLSVPWLLPRLGLPEDSGPVLQALALLAPLTGLNAAAIAWLNRDLRFRHLGLLSVAAKGIGQGLIALPLALWGAGVWALVAGLLAQPLAGVVLGLWLAPPAWPRLGRWRQILRATGVGLRFSAIRILGATRTHMMPVVTGILAGTTAAGLYDRAALLSLVLTETLLAGIGRILTPVYCRLAAEQPEQMADTFLLFTRRILCVALPLTAGLTAAAGPFILTVLGSRWADAVAPLQILALMATCRVMAVTAGSVIEARGDLRPYMTQTALTLLGFSLWLLVRQPESLTLLLWGALTAEACSLLCLIVLAARTLHLPLWQTLEPFAVGILTALPVGAVMWACTLTDLPPALCLALAMVTGGLCTAGLLLGHPLPRVRQDLRAMLRI